jgi:PAS domain S-box-containing protein
VHDKAWAQLNGMVAFAGYPLVVEDRLIGVMALFARRPLSESVLDTLASTADTIAQGIVRKHAEEDLRASEAFLAEGQRLSQTGSWAWNPDQDIRYWSEECYRVLSFNPQDGLPRFEEFFQRIHPDDQPGFRELIQGAIREKAEWEADYRIVHPGGAVRDIHVVGHPVLSTSGHLVEFVGTVIDVTERKRAAAALQETRAELERVSRVTMMGELAASIAHEVNQPLAGVVTSANAALNWLAANPPNLCRTREALERVLRDGARGGEVLARIRALLKRTAPAKALVGVNQVVRDMLELTAGELRQHEIELRLDLAPNVPAVLGDTVQLQQVLLNLIKNAIDAMAGIASSQRTLRIQCRLGELDGKPAVVLEVSDTGIGFSGTDGSRLFEAFHTTKPQGMGMGLWISRSIVENHHGRLTALPNDGPGATFMIMLPETSGELV